ncbi:uncharacterized protein LOC121367390 [Gigantopelta aegis]|uniref:uncharacterized protein LOC121367390 n=1 Tax=Gigantopelta aegis TaxID=1735272 RepID=UPI001B88855E|nr:uncharacterized protein LOC121367390 [Gigantopelta aegis]
MSSGTYTPRTDGVATIDHQEVHVDLTRRGPVPNDSKPDPNVQYSSSSNQVVVSQTTVPIVAQQPDPKRKPKDFVMTSCFVIFACNFIFGLLGYHFGVKSNWAWQLGDEVEARKKARTALLFVILGVCVGVLTYVLVFSLYFTVGKEGAKDRI